MTGIKVEYELTDGGSTAKLTSATGLLKKDLDGVTATANRASAAVKAAMAPSGGSKTMGAIKGASASPQESIEYGQARAAVGTGAAGRDFAKQAQGLGGLVHVYATFAANLFAITAAFTALKEAAATETLVKGLDQLGASSGKNLGTLSKQIADTTGGALSLRDAMTAVAQASSAGLGTKQIQDLAVVAAKASNALGIGMSDAVSRLSRGISKIEPELLDELGIFVKVDDATTKYALSVGKTTQSLSDFERRQAFANAVLEQGKLKFAAIESAPNPYDKLLASITNLATAGLELVNKVLSPIVTFLAESPTALAAVFATIATILLKQAIPAIGQFREGMKKSADDALASAQAFKESFGDRFQGRLEQRFKLPDLKAEVQKFEETLANIKLPPQLAKGGAGKLLTTQVEDAKALAATEKALALRNTQLETNMKGTKQMSEVQRAAAEQERNDLQKIIAAYNKKLELINATSAAQGVADKKIDRLDPERLAQKRYENLRKTASSMSAVAAAAETAQVTGIRDAWRELNVTVEKDGITGISKYTTLAKGGLAAVGSRIMGLAAAFGPVAEFAAVAVTVISSIDSVLSQASKEQEIYTGKIEATHAAVKTVNDTFDLYTSKRKDAFSIEGIVAFNTALSGTSDAFKDQLDALEKYRKASGIWDTIKDTISNIWGGSNLQKAKKSAQESVTAVLKSLEFSSGKGKATADIAALIGIDASKIDDTIALKKAISNLNESDLGKLSDEFKKIEEREQATTNAAKAFTESLTTIDKLVDQMIQANAFSDLQGKLGVELVSAAQKFALALQDPLKALLDIEALAKDPKALAVLGEVNIREIFKATQAVKDLNEAESELTKTAADRAEQTSKSNVNLGAAMDVSGFGTQIQDQAQQIADANYNESIIKLGLLKKQAAEFAQTQANLVKTITDEGFKRVMLGLRLAEEQAGISVEKARASVASSAGLDTSKKEYDLKVQEINIQQRLIDASYEAQMATMKNTETLSELTATQQILAAEALRAKGGTADEVKANAKLADSMTKAAQKTLDVITVKGALKAGKAPEAGTSESTLSLAKSSLQSEKIPEIQRQSAEAKQRADKEIAAIERITKEREYQLKLSLDQNAVNKEANSIQLELLNSSSQLNSYSSESLINAKLVIQERLLEADIAAKRLQLDAQSAKIERESASATTESYREQTKLVQDKIANLYADKQAKKLALEYNAIKEITTAQQAEISFKSNIELQTLQTTNSVIETRIALDQKRLDTMAQMGMFDEQTIIALKAQAELEGQKLKYQQESAKLTTEVALKEAALAGAKRAKDTAESAFFANPTDATATQFAAATTGVSSAQAALDLSKLQQDSAKQINDLTTQSIAKQEELNQKFAAQKQYLTDIASVATSLGSIFGDVGTKMGTTISVIADFGVKQKNAAEGIAEMGKRAAEAYKKASEADDTEDREKFIKEGSKALDAQAKLQTKAKKDEITGYAQIAGAAKGMFKEKSTGYKLMAGIEKAMHIANIAMKATEMAADGTLTISSIGNSLARAGAKGLEAIMGAFAAPFPIDFIAGAAMISIVSSLIGSIGGGGHASLAFSPDSKQRQEVAGTGMTYDAQGNKVETGGGVFGDSSAKSESIKNSLEIMKNNSIEGLDYDNKLLKAMTKLSDAMTGAAQQIFSIPGLRLGGTSFGTQPGKEKIEKGGLFGTGFLGGVFGGGVSANKSIESAGIQLRGSLQQIIDDTAGSILQYKDVLTQFHEDGGWFGDDSDWTTRNREVDTVKKSVKDAIIDVFKEAKNTFNEIAAVANTSSSTVQAAFDSIDFQGIEGDIDSMGLSGQEALDQLNAVISKKLDETAKTAFPYFDQFKKFGEGFLETVIRVTDGNNKVDQALRSMGSNFDISAKTIGNSGFNISEVLIKAAGGLENFMSQADFFTQNFLDDAERLAPIRTSVSKEMSSLGISLLTTKKDFKNLVLAQNLNTKAGQEMYQALMDLAPGFNTVIDGITTGLAETKKNLEGIVSSFTDFAKNIKTFRESLILSASSTATPLEKYAEAKTQFEKTYALALSGDKDAMGKVTGSAQTLLDLGKSLYASSDEYSNLFNYISEKMSSAEISALASVDVAQLQLNALDSSVNLLTEIAANTAATAGVTAHATGGYASGWAMVGERGPEMVNFSNPGQVYTADQTAGMFTPNNGNQAMRAVVVELQQLREEVTQLRKDQQKQTGDIIISNYDANQKASEEIATAVVISSQDVAWSDRSKSEIK